VLRDREVQLLGFYHALGEPYWTGRLPPGADPVGHFTDELKTELFIWRPLLAGKVTLTELKSGVCSLTDLLKLNALLDHEIAAQHAAMSKPSR
jgi:hypothetical protein